jgi:hypothetical protein
MEGGTMPATRRGRRGDMGSRIPSKNDRAVVLAMLDLKRSARGPVTGIIGDWLVARAKRMWPRYAGFQWFSRTNVRGNWTIVSYHHPAQLCWEWSLSFAIGKATCARSWNPLKWFYHYAGQTAIGIPMLAELRFHRQSYGYMLSNAAEHRLRTYAFSEDHPHD